MLATAGVFAVCVPVLGINLQQPMLMPVPNLVRDRRAVGAVLTPAQIAQLPMMEASDMMSGMKKP